MNDVEILAENNNLRIKVPLTSPTGRARTKVRSNPSEFGQPYSVKQNEITNDCYIEWQIGYDTDDKEKTGVLTDIFYIRKGVTKYGYELSKILYDGLKMQIWGKSELDSLYYYIENIKPEYYFESMRQIIREKTEDIDINGISLKTFVDKYPMFLIKGKDYDIEICLKHKQRAVGFQAMIYVCLPLVNADEQLIGRRANTNEHIHFTISKGKNDFVFDTFKAFALASDQHNEDMKNIINIIKEVLGE